MSEARAGLAFDVRGGAHAGAGSVEPQANGTALRDRLAARFGSVSTLEQLQQAIRFAETELRSARISPDVTPETVEQFRQRLLHTHTGRHAVEVASIERVSTSYVRVIRARAGLDALYGRPPSTRRNLRP